jgi:hypothetical protein
MGLNREQAGVKLGSSWGQVVVKLGQPGSSWVKLGSTREGQIAAPYHVGVTEALVHAPGGVLLLTVLLHAVPVARGTVVHCSARRKHFVWGMGCI